MQKKKPTRAAIWCSLTTKRIIRKLSKESGYKAMRDYLDSHFSKLVN